MLTEILGFISSGVGGSVIGAIGATISRHQEGKQKIAELKLDLQKLELSQAHELAMADKQHTAQLAELAAANEGAIIKGEYAALETSIQSDKATYSVGSTNKWLIITDVIRGTMRPALTGLLVSFSMLVLLYLLVKYGHNLTPDQSYKLQYNILESLLVGANVALAWWFGTRTHLSKGN